MIIIYNNIIPFKGYRAINLFGIIFVRKSAKPLSEKTIFHEKIHTAQMKELLYIFFYLWYVIEWLIKLFRYKTCHKAYRNISFEREAYTNDGNINYLKDRKLYSFTKYI